MSIEMLQASVSGPLTKALKITGKLGLVGCEDRPQSDFLIIHDGKETLGIDKRCEQRVGVGHLAHSVQIEMPVRFDMVPAHQV